MGEATVHVTVAERAMGEATVHVTIAGMGIARQNPAEPFTWRQ
jgi:hypothetical protein